MRRIMSFLDEKTGKELVLPVTPSGYTWAHPNRVESIQLDQIGEINLPGGAMMGSCTLDNVLLPTRLYSFCNPGAVANPYVYLEQLEIWSDNGTVVRWMVSGTPVNAPVIIESIDQGERDGTNDLYITIRMKQYRKPEVPVLAVSGGGAQTSRDDGTGAAQERTYTIQSGDTLWGIAKKYYGSGTEYKRLAEANRDQIPNPNLIYPGQTIVIPAGNNLPQAGADSPSVALADETKSTWDPATGTWNLTL